MRNPAIFRCKTPLDVVVWAMSTHKLARTLSSAIAPRASWTSLILDTMGPGSGFDGPGKLRLEYGTGRQSEDSGPKVAIEEPVHVAELDDKITFVVGQGTDRQTLAADELSRRLYKVALDVFGSYENKKSRPTKRGGKTKRPRKMWVRLVLCDADGRELDKDSFDLFRDDDERVVGFDDPAEDDAAEILSSGSSHETEERLSRVLLRERAEMHGAQMTLVEQSQTLAQTAIEQAKAAAEQVKVLGGALMDFSEMQEGFMRTSLKVHAEAVEMDAAAQVAKVQAEAMYRDAESERAGFWETPAGAVMQGQVGGIVERVVESVSDADKVADFLGRVGAKAMHYYEKWTSRGRPPGTVGPG